MNIYYTDDYQGGSGESHKLLEKAIAVYTGDEEGAKKLTGALKKGEHGKPYIDGFCCFSISHTGSVWAVLIADKECGLDIQQLKKCNYSMIAKRFFPKDDSEVSSAEDFFRIWTRREAFVKAIGSTVYDGNIPSVRENCAIMSEKIYIINDIDFEGHTELYAAICAEGDIAISTPEFHAL